MGPATKLSDRVFVSAPEASGIDESLDAIVPPRLRIAAKTKAHR